MHEVDASGITARPSAEIAPRLPRGSFFRMLAPRATRSRRAQMRRTASHFRDSVLAHHGCLLCAAFIRGSCPPKLRFGVHLCRCAPHVPSRSLCGCVGTSVREYVWQVVASRTSSPLLMACAHRRLHDLDRLRLGGAYTVSRSARLAPTWLALRAGNDRTHYVAAIVFFAWHVRRDASVDVRYVGWSAVRVIIACTDQIVTNK